MAGSYMVYYTGGKLATLDLSEAKIVEGGDYYYDDFYGGVYYTSTDIISESAFSGCRSLTSLTIPSSITEIGNDAFENCESLKECNCLLDADLKTYLNSSHDWGRIPVEEIKYYCNGQELTKLEIPFGVDKIGGKFSIEVQKSEGFRLNNLYLKTPRGLGARSPHQLSYVKKFNE